VQHRTPMLCARVAALFSQCWEGPQEHEEQAEALHVESNGEVEGPPQTRLIKRQLLTDPSNDC
jgi:hypothetical protein